MPHFFLHIHNSTGFVEDEEGQELTGLDEARTKALEGIRSVLAEEVLHGAMDLRGRIDIVDDTGNSLVVMPFREAVAVQFDEDSE